MFAPLKIWRRWHRKVNLTQKRHALAAAVAATAVPPLVMARGHRIMNVPEIPLVFEKISAEKTKEFVKLLEKFGLGEELERCKDSKKIRASKGKWRNKRYVMRKGPLLIHAAHEHIKAITACRNIPGMDTLNVHRMNILDLAPGGHIGRLVIWTKEAFESLDKVFTEEKTGYIYATSVMNNADLGSIINSDQIQKVLKPVLPNSKPHENQKKNPLKNKAAMKKLNPFAPTKLEMEKAAVAESKKAREAMKKKHRGLKKVGKKWMKSILAGLTEVSKAPEKEDLAYLIDEEVLSVHEEMSSEEEEEKKEEKEGEEKKEEAPAGKEGKKETKKEKEAVPEKGAEKGKEKGGDKKGKKK
jgi:large subunit ribosomal protein L4e